MKMVRAGSTGFDGQGGFDGRADCFSCPYLFVVLQGGFDGRAERASAAVTGAGMPAEGGGPEDAGLRGGE